jgi:hypothetical protein
VGDSGLVRFDSVLFLLVMIRVIQLLPVCQFPGVMALLSDLHNVCVCVWISGALRVAK